MYQLFLDCQQLTTGNITLFYFKFMKKITLILLLTICAVLFYKLERERRILDEIHETSILYSYTVFNKIKLRKNSDRCNYAKKPFSCELRSKDLQKIGMLRSELPSDFLIQIKQINNESPPSNLQVVTVSPSENLSQFFYIKLFPGSYGFSEEIDKGFTLKTERFESVKITEEFNRIEILNSKKQFGKRSYISFWQSLPHLQQFNQE